MRKLLLVLLLAIPIPAAAQLQSRSEDANIHYVRFRGAGVDTMNGSCYVSSITINRPVTGGSVTITNGVAVKDTVVSLQITTATGYPIRFPLGIALDSSIVTVTGNGMGVSVAVGPGRIPGSSSSYSPPEAGAAGSQVGADAAGSYALVFVQNPTNADTLAYISPAITVKIVDVFGTTLDTATAQVTLSFDANPGGATLGGTTTVAAVAGIATFNNITVDTASAGYTLVATSSGLVSDTSTSFDVVVPDPPPVALLFFVEPTNAEENVAISPAIQVLVVDSLGSTVDTSTNSVTLAIANNPAAGTLAGTLTQAAVAGVATFNDISIDNAGTGYTLEASSGALTPDTSAAFNITAAEAGYFPVAPSVERATELTDVWFVDETEMVRQEDTAHYSRTSELNLLNNAGAADTLKLVALKGELIGWETILHSDVATSDSIEVYLDSLLNQSDGTVIKNDSGRVYNNPQWYAGRPIQHFVVNYFNLTATDTSDYTNPYYFGSYGNAPTPRANYIGNLPSYLSPADADGNIIYSSSPDYIQGGYPFTVPESKIQAVHTDLFVPKSTTAGTYNGHLEVLEGGSRTRVYPVKLTVHNITMPDTLFRLAMYFDGRSQAIRFLGVGEFSAARYELEDNMAKMLRRNGITMLTRQEVLDSILAHRMKYFTNWFWRSANGYEGPGDTLGNNMYFYGLYDMPAASGDTAGWESSVGWPTAATSGYATLADQIEQARRDSCGNSNDLVRWLVYGAEEPNLHTRDMNQWIQARCKLIQNSAGVGQYLPWIQTGTWVGDTLTGATQLIGYVDEFTVTQVADTFDGIHSLTDPTPASYKAYEVQALGIRVGHYNGVSRQAAPAWTIVDVPLTDPRAMLWVAHKYNLDHVWNWHSNYQAEHTDQYWANGYRWDPLRFPRMDTLGVSAWNDQEDQLVWSTTDSVNNRVMTGIPSTSAMMSMRIVAIRRGQMDYGILRLAEDLGVDMDSIYYGVVGRAYNDYGLDPAWPEAHTEANHLSRLPHYALRGEVYEAAKREAIDSIIARTIPAGPPYALDFLQGPTAADTNATISPSVTVRIEDTLGILIDTSTANVTIAIGTNPNTGTLAGTLTKAAVAGVATFDDLSIDSAGVGYTLIVTSAGLVPDTSAAFTISNVEAGCSPDPVDFTTFSSAVLEGQNNWDDLGNNDDFTATNGSGLQSSEAAWGAMKFAVRTTDCALDPDAQFAYFIVGQAGGTSNGEGFGIAVRVNAAGDTGLVASYDESGGAIRLVSVRSGNSQITYASRTVNDGDSISIYVSGDDVTVYHNSTSIITVTNNASVPQSGTLTKWGPAASGETSGWYMRRAGAGNWTP